MRLDVDENYVNFVEIGEDALYPLVLETSRDASLRVEGGVLPPSTPTRRIDARQLHEALAARWRIKALAEYLHKLTEFLDQEASKGFDPNDMGQLMKFLHALQAQVLIVTAQRATSIGTPSWRRWRGGKFPRPEIPPTTCRGAFIYI
jgi:hypothetical protein